MMLSIVVALSVSACSMLGPKPHTAYTRPDVQRPIEKLVVFPVTNFQGVQDTNAKQMEASFTGKWTEMYGKENIVPAGPVVFQLMDKFGKDTYGEFIKTLDNVSAVEQLHKNPKFRQFISQVTGKLGNYHFALAIVDGSKETYDQKNPVNLHIGVFDSTNLTWKWITKIQDKKGMWGNWEAASQLMVNNSFDLIKKLEASPKRDIANTKTK